jgi:ArsR family transcriptional regulator
MKLSRLRQVLKAISDDTRIRILNLLLIEELNVAELCDILNISQSTISKHLTSLRLNSLVGDKREGQFVYYHITRPLDSLREAVFRLLGDSVTGIEECVSDIERLKGIKKKVKS